MGVETSLLSQITFSSSITTVYRCKFTSFDFMTCKISASLTILKSCWIINFNILAAIEKSIVLCGNFFLNFPLSYF